MEQLAAQFSRTWLRPPAPRELDWLQLAGIAMADDDGSMCGNLATGRIEAGTAVDDQVHVRFQRAFCPIAERLLLFWGLERYWPNTAQRTVSHPRLPLATALVERSSTGTPILAGTGGAGA